MPRHTSAAAAALDAAAVPALVLTANCCCIRAQRNVGAGSSAALSALFTRSCGSWCKESGVTCTCTCTGWAASRDAVPLGA